MKNKSKWMYWRNLIGAPLLLLAILMFLALFSGIVSAVH